MADDNRDLLMKMELTPGNYVVAECSAVVSSDDKLASGFKGTASDGNITEGNYFAVEDFSFEVSVSDPTDKKDAMELQARNTQDQVDDLGRQVGDSLSALQEQQQDLHSRIADLEALVAKLSGSTASRGARGVAANDTKIKTSGKTSTQYERFMSKGRDALRNPGDRYPSDLEQVTISKRMDRSSTTLFDKCRSSFKFASATILKRKAVGEDTLRGYLRIDFYDVMLTDLNWDHDEVIKEKFKFVCRKAVVSYAVETANTVANGKTAAVLTAQPTAEWSVMATKK